MKLTNVASQLFIFHALLGYNMLGFRELLTLLPKFKSKCGQPEEDCEIQELDADEY